MNPFDPSLFTQSAPCLPCCDSVIGVCGCELNIPPLLDPYEDYATAASAIADFVADCYGYIEVPDGDAANLNSFSFDNSTPNEFILSGDVSSDPGAAEMSMWCGFSALATSELDFSWVVSSSPPCTPAIVTLSELASGITFVLDNGTYNTALELVTCSVTSNATPSSVGMVTLTVHFDEPDVTGGTNPDSVADQYITIAGVNYHDGDTLSVPVTTLYCMGGGPGLANVEAFIVMTNSGTFGPINTLVPASGNPTGCCHYRYDCNGNLLTVNIYKCSSGTLVLISSTEYEEATTTDTFTIPSDGIYVIEIVAIGDGQTTQVDCAFTMVCDMAMVPTPVIALWDDSGTTRQLEACPKFLLPPATEFTGDWYADETEAQSAIDDHTSNCVGYITNPFVTFDATDGGSTLELDFTSDAVSSGGLYGSGQSIRGSINGVGGDTLSSLITLSVSAGAVLPSSGDWYVFDQNGDFLFSDSFSGYVSPVTFNYVLPHTGRFSVLLILSISGLVAPFVFHGNMLTSSSGTMTVNEIQALFDSGLDCPSRLDCT